MNQQTILEEMQVICEKPISLSDKLQADLHWSSYKTLLLISRLQKKEALHLEPVAFLLTVEDLVNWIIKSQERRKEYE